MSDWLSTSVPRHCELQPLAVDVVAGIATGFSFTMANGKLFSWLLRLLELSAVALTWRGVMLLV